MKKLNAELVESILDLTQESGVTLQEIALVLIELTKDYKEISPDTDSLSVAVEHLESYVQAINKADKSV